MKIYFLFIIVIGVSVLWLLTRSDGSEVEKSEISKDRNRVKNVSLERTTATGRIQSTTLPPKVEGTTQGEWNKTVPKNTRASHRRRQLEAKRAMQRLKDASTTPSSVASSGAEEEPSLMDKVHEILGPALFPIPLLLALLPLAYEAMPHLAWVRFVPEVKNQTGHSNGTRTRSTKVNTTTSTNKTNNLGDSVQRHILDESLAKLVAGIPEHKTGKGVKRD